MPAEVVDARAEYHDSPFLVFGRREKLQAAGPFLQLLDEFRRHLATVKDLVVIGYGLADPHVNVLVSYWCSNLCASEIACYIRVSSSIVRISGHSAMGVRESFDHHQLDRTLIGLRLVAEENT